MLHLLLAIVVSASIDSTQMVIGEQTRMHVEVTHDATEQMQLPVFGAQLPHGVEAVKTSRPDTTLLENGRVQLSQDLTITSFTDTTYTVRPFAVTAGGDTVYAEPAQLTILRPEGVDEMTELNDIKDIENVPIWWWDVCKWILLGLGILLLCAGGYYLWLWYKKNKKTEEEPINPELLRPAEEVALEKLDAIKAAKIWTEGRFKEYHTDLTDVVREYIGRRFDVHSTEKTSDETLRELKPMLLDKGQWTMDNGRGLYDKLNKMLQLADLVKFAKWNPTPDENEQALTTAYDFVNETTMDNGQRTMDNGQSDNGQKTKEEEV